MNFPCLKFIPNHTLLDEPQTSENFALCIYITQQIHDQKVSVHDVCNLKTHVSHVT